MAKVTGPLLSFGASGQIANAQVYANWRGINYARQKVIPANPKTTGQMDTRNAFSYLSNVWKFAGSAFQAPWTAGAAGQPLTARNLLMKRNISTLRSAANNDAMVMSPGANGGLSASAATATGGVLQITTSLTAPTLPTGWTVSKAIAIAILESDPQDNGDWSTYEAESTASPYEPTITVPAAGTYVVGLWFVYQKPDATLAYGPSITTTATVTAS